MRARMRLVEGVRRRSPAPLLAALLLLAAPGGRAAAPETTLIRGALVVDGTGRAPFAASVRLVGDRIEAVGELAPRQGERVVEAAGLALAPGFIDTHSHHDADADPAQEAVTSQGITTIVVGQDGESRLPLASFFAALERSPWAVNVASYAGHGTLREEVLGEGFRREATADEVAAMARLLARELDAGALGLSTGLEYDPGIYSSGDEVLALARVAAAAGGRYVSHLRSEDRAFEAALEELVTIGREAGLPVQISHFKLARRGLWGQAGSVLARLDEARRAGVAVSADLYPYEQWQSTLTVLFPQRDFTDRAEAAYALTEVTRPEDVLLTRFEAHPQWEGETLAAVAMERGTDPVTALIDLIALAEETGAEEEIVARSMQESDIAALLAWSESNVCSDGSARSGHPRGWGAFPRVFRRFVRELGVLSLEEAVAKMTSLAARHVGLEGRGVVEPGAVADLVLFDPRTIADRATFAEPALPSVGIEAVWVAGVAVREGGRDTGARPGRVLRRGGG